MKCPILGHSQRFEIIQARSLLTWFYLKMLCFTAFTVQDLYLLNSFVCVFQFS